MLLLIGVINQLLVSGFTFAENAFYDGLCVFMTSLELLLVFTDVFSNLFYICLVSAWFGQLP